MALAQLAIALAVVFAVDLLPAFGPPTWAVLVFFSLDFNLPAVPLALGRGLAGGKFEFAFGGLPFEAQLNIPYWGTAVELGECLELAHQGKIHAHVERFSLEDAPRPTRRCAPAKSTAAP